MKHDKQKAAADFFQRIGKPVHEITPNDIKSWQIELEKRNLAQGTIYGRISQISSFYEWLMKSSDMAGWVVRNPVTLARPKAPKAYQSESTKSLDDDQVRVLIQVVMARNDVVGKRDFALLMFYLLTGMRREEVARLKWGDLKLDDVMVISVKVKGGELVNRESNSPMVKSTLLDYLEVSGRLDKMTPESPLGTRNDRAGKPGRRLSSHSISKAMKKYAKQAGIDNFHMHQTRHNYARIVAEESGSMRETQDALGHRSEAVTRVYVQRIGVKRDKYSSAIADRLFQFSNQ